MFEWKKKLRNKTFLITMVTTVMAFVYQVLALLEVVPKYSQENITQVIMLVINAMAGLGILVNPNTDGIADHKGTE